MGVMARGPSTSAEEAVCSLKGVAKSFQERAGRFVCLSMFEHEREGYEVKVVRKWLARDSSRSDIVWRTYNEKGNWWPCPYVERDM